MTRKLIVAAALSLAACQKMPGTIGNEAEITIKSPHERSAAECRQAADLNNPEAKSRECPAPSETDSR